MSRFSASKIAEKYRFFRVTLIHSFVYETLTEFIIRSDYKILRCEVAMSSKLVPRSRLIEQCWGTIESNVCTSIEARSSHDSWLSSPLPSCEWHHCSEFIFVQEGILSRPASPTLFTFVHEKEVKSEYFHVLAFAMAFRTVHSYVENRNRIDMFAVD